MKLIDLISGLFKKNNNSIAKIEKNGVLSNLPSEILEIIIRYLDLKSVLEVRALSKEHLEKVHHFLSHLETAKQFSVINLDTQDLTAVGEDVMYLKYGLSDTFGEYKEPSAKEIQKSFTNRVKLFSNPADASAYIKRETQVNDWHVLERKPHQMAVTVKNPHTLFRMATTEGKGLVLSVRDEEITEKLTFK